MLIQRDFRPSNADIIWFNDHLSPCTMDEIYEASGTGWCFYCLNKDGHIIRRQEDYVGRTRTWYLNVNDEKMLILYMLTK